MMNAQGNNTMTDLKVLLMDLVEDLMYQKAEDARSEVSYSKPTEEAQRRLDDFLETVDVVLKQSAPMVAETAVNSWQGEVDRQGGSFTDQEILDSQTWK